MASTADLEAEILAEMEEDPYAYVTPVNDVITIDPETRTIHLQASEALFGTEEEKDVERKYFKCPRIVGDNIDLAAHQIYISYMAVKDKNATLIPELLPETYWCEDVNVDDTDRDVISLYHAHGESEQFHSEIKTDMDLERFPSGKFDTNELVLELAMLAYNILRMIGDESIGPNHPMNHPIKRRRIGTVIKNLVMMACHITSHARRSKIGLGGSNVWRRTFKQVCLSFSCL